MILVKMKATSKPEISQSTEESTALQSSETADHTEADASAVMGGALEAAGGDRVSVFAPEIQSTELTEDFGFLLK